MAKGKEKVKGYADIAPGHRIDYSERSQKTMAEFFKASEKLPNPEEFNESNYSLFSAPTMVYLTLNKGHSKYSVLDLGVIEMAIMLAAKDHGVDSIPAYMTIMFPDVLRKHLKISDKEDIVIGIALGYEEKCALNDHRSVKLNLEDVCHFFN